LAIIGAAIYISSSRFKKPKHANGGSYNSQPVATQSTHSGDDQAYQNQKSPIVHHEDTSINTNAVLHDGIKDLITTLSQLKEEVRTLRPDLAELSSRVSRLNLLILELNCPYRVSCVPSDSPLNQSSIPHNPSSEGSVSQTVQSPVNDHNPCSDVSPDASGVDTGVASKRSKGVSIANAAVLGKDPQISPSDRSLPTDSSAISNQHDDSCSSVSIVAEYQQSLDRGERSLPASLYLAELNITKDSEDALMRSSDLPTQLMTVPGGGSYLLVVGKDHRYWLVPDFKTLSSFKVNRPNKRIFSYEPQIIHTPELRQPAEVKEVGDLWEVVKMGVIAVPG
jgi:hypothetical protein